jgi:2-hydroxychromene-2-carboxylate isomerase
MTEPVRFHFDFISPWAYIAWHRVHAIAARHQRALVPVPVLFAALLDAHGTVGPAEVPAKRAYFQKASTRAARAAGLPFAPPPHHPFNPLLALRIASAPHGSEAEARCVIDALFAAVWAGGPGLDDADTVRGVLDRAGLDGAALVDAAGADDAKARLRAATDAAIAGGVFGVPTATVGGELFWGCDSLDDLDRFLAGDDPVTEADLARWALVTPTAKRPRGPR